MGIKEVANLAHVSPSTVSSVFTGNQKVKEATAQRVLEVAKQLGYYPNHIARSLRYGMNKTIAAIIDDLRSPSVMSVLSGIEDASFDRQFTVFTANTNQKNTKEEYYIKSVISNQVAGVLLEPTGCNTALYGELNRYTPTVFIDRIFPSLALSSVMPDHEKGACLATEHLAQHGHQKVGIITGPLNLSPGSLRLKGFLKTAKTLGLSTEERFIKSGPSTREFGYEAAKALLKKNKDLTALYATTSSLTVGVVQALFELEIAFPGNIAFIGSGSFEWASLVKPALTSVTYDYYSMGTIATRFLFLLIDEPAARDNPQNFVIPPRLEIRQSCGCK